MLTYANMRIFLIEILFFFLLSVVPAFAQEDPYWKQVGDQIKAGNYAGALKEADLLLAGKPDDVLLLRLKGISLMQLGNTDAAVAVLQKALKLDPESIACRYYLAQALAYRGSVLAAIELLKEIQQKAPGSRYAQQAAHVLQELEHLATTAQAISDKKRWNMTLRTSGAFDDNAADHSDKQSSVTKIRSSTQAIASYFELRPIDQNIDHLPFTLGLGYANYQSWYDSEAIEPFDLSSETGKLFLRRGGRVDGKAYSAEFYGDYTNSRLLNKAYSAQEGLGTSVNFQWVEWATISPSYSITWEDFKDNTTQPGLYSRDGYTQSVGVDQRFYTFGKNVVFGVGYAYHWANATGSQFDTKSNVLNASVNVSLPLKFDLSTGFTYERDGYFQYSPDPKRADNVYNASAVLSHPLWNENTLLELSYNYTSADSSINFANYRRSLYSLAVSYYM